MSHHSLGRRELLRRGSLIAAATAAVPLVDTALNTATARAGTGSPTDPDTLFEEGWFDAADRGYARQLRHNPDDAHALAQRGYIALLSNQFGQAETFLTRALELAPDDTFSRQRLVDCYVRQDQFARAVPQLRTLGGDDNQAVATWYAALTGVPYHVSGADSTRLQIVSMDPLPIVEASVEGSALQPFIFDTGAAGVGISPTQAQKLGLKAVSSSTGIGGGQEITRHYGVLDSFRIGGIQLRNLPVAWGDPSSDDNSKAVPRGLDPNTVGVIGTEVFWHFLTTLDYQGYGLILRRKSQKGLHRFHAAARRKGYRPLPLWLAEHFPFTLGSLNKYGPRVVRMDTGGPGVGVGCSEQVAQQAGIPIDDQYKTYLVGSMHPSIYPDTVSLGDAVGRHLPGVVNAGDSSNQFGFQPIGNFTHEFFRPYAATFDFTDMNFYVTPTVPDGS